MNCVCFFSSAERWAQTKISIESFRTHHGDSLDYLLLICSEKDLDAPGYVKKVRLDQCHLGQEIFAKQGYIAGIVRVMIIDYALRAGYDKIITLDGDMETFGSMVPILDLLEVHNAVVTPHILSPVPNDDLTPGEDAFVISGNYNSAFTAFKNTEPTKVFIDWWLQVCMRKGEVNVPLARCAEQGWLRFVADFLDDVKILRDPAYNVAYWNIFQRDFSLTDGQWTVGGRPLVLFHYSGLDPKAPEKMSVYQNRYVASGHALEFYQIYCRRLG